MQLKSMLLHVRKPLGATNNIGHPPIAGGVVGHVSIGVTMNRSNLSNAYKLLNHLTPPITIGPPIAIGDVGDVSELFPQIHELEIYLTSPITIDPPIVIGVDGNVIGVDGNVIGADRGGIVFMRKYEN